MRSSPPNPTELVIRDYLSRLSMAARGRLSSEEQRALETRTREFIERSSSQLGSANSMQVAALLSRLGDPAVLVDQELARLAAERGETELAGQPAGRMRRRPAKTSWHWPTSNGNPDLQTQLLSGGDVESAEDVEAVREPPIWVPRQQPSPDIATVDDQQDEATVGRPRWPGEVFMRSTDQPGQAPVADASGQQAWPRSRTAATVLSEAREHKLEALAAAVMGLGGLLYPPVWLLGAALALTSKVWDYRDKWPGLAGPVLLLVIGTAAGVSLGKHHATMSAYVHEAWVYADILSRLGAVLGAYYLAWRVGHPRQEPEVPPWNRPRRIT